MLPPLHVIGIPRHTPSGSTSPHVAADTGLDGEAGGRGVWVRGGSTHLLLPQTPTSLRFEAVVAPPPKLQTSLRFWEEVTPFSKLETSFGLWFAPSPPHQLEKNKKMKKMKNIENIQKYQKMKISKK